jgi:hypothetical protein
LGHESKERECGDECRNGGFGTKLLQGKKTTSAPIVNGRVVSLRCASLRRHGKRNAEMKTTGNVVRAIEEARIPSNTWKKEEQFVEHV